MSSILKQNQNKLTQIVDINVRIELQELIDLVEGTTSLENNDAFFGKLSEVSKAKSILEDALERFKQVEDRVKQVVNEKAVELYGDEWRAIKGDGYKITRSYSGAVYKVDENVDKEFLVTKVTANTKAIGKFLEATNKLPEGVKLNKERSEVIRITLKENEEDIEA